MKHEKDYKKAQERLYFLVFAKERQTLKERGEVERLKKYIKSYQDENLFKINEGHYLEITDRLDCQSNIIETLLLSHTVLTNKKYTSQRNKIIKAQSLISEVYQFLDKISDNNSSKETKKDSVEIENLIEIIDDYLNAGDKPSRAKASAKAKEAYKKYYGVEYKNRTERAA